jgi:16S rRNA (cytosine967-C5)-methyltransferase
VAHTKRPADVARLTGQQDRLLDAAAALVEPGGRLVYAVCSLEPAEGRDRVAAALARHADLALAPIDAAELAGLPATVSDGQLRSLPSDLAEAGGMDGFYAARLVRRG